MSMIFLPGCSRSVSIAISTTKFRRHLRANSRPCLMTKPNLAKEELAKNKNIKVENNRPNPEDLLREINRGGFSTGYSGQSPERLKAHMKNQGKFDLVTLRAKADEPDVGVGDTAEEALWGALETGLTDACRAGARHPWGSAGCTQ